MTDEWGQDAIVEPAGGDWGSDAIPVAGKSDPLVEPSTGLLERMQKNPALDRIFKATDKAVAESWYGDPVGLDPDNRAVLEDLGILPNPRTGQNNILRAFNQSLIEPLAYLSDAAFKAMQTTIVAPQSFVGAAAKEVGGESAQNEWTNLSNFLLATGGAPEFAFMKPGIGPKGNLTETNVGGLPRSSEFKAVADAIDPSVQSIIKDLYDTKGVLPKEIQADMVSDITIPQDLLGGSKPTAYTGKTDIALTDDFKAILDERGGGKEPPIDLDGTALPGPGAEPLKLTGPQQKLKDAQDSILSKIDVGSHDTKRPWNFDRLYYNFMDDLNPVKVATKEALKKMGKPSKLPVSEDPYSLFRLTRGTFGKADHFLMHGTYDFNTYATTGKGLKEIIAPVEKDLNGLRAYLASKRAMELNAYGIETGFDIGAAQTVIAKGKQFEKVQKELVDYQNGLAKYLKDSGVLSDKAYSAMLEAHKEYVPFFRMMEEKPMVSMFQGVGQKLGAKNPLKKIEGSERAIIDPLESVIKNTYAYIALAERNAAGVKLVDLLKQGDAGSSYLTELLPYPGKPPKISKQPAIAGKADQLSLEAPVVENGVTKYFNDADVPKASGKDVEIIEPVIERVKGADKDFIDAEWETVIPDRDLRVVVTTAGREQVGDTIHVFRDGKRETYKVNDPDLLAAWRGLDKDSANIFIKLLALPASTLRAGAVLTPEFLTRNLIRDFFSAVVNTKGGIFSPIDTAKGLKSIITKDQSYQDWLKGGGANSALVSMDRRYLQENLLKLGAETGLATRSWNVVTSPIRMLRMASELAENSTRVGEFRKLMKDKTGKAVIQKAAMSSREITLDFARIGAKMRAANQISAFLNATVQSPDRLARAFKERPVSTSLKIAGGVMVPSALLWWANKDDERYKQLSAWEKDLFWIVTTDDWQNAGSKDKYPDYLTRYQNGTRQVNKGTIYRIPKPFETGIIFGSGLERSLDAFYKDNPKAFKDYSNSIYEMLVPNMVPTGSIPVLEQFSNRSYLTGDPLISTYNEQKLPEYQYNPYTSETAKAVGQLIGAFPGMEKAQSGNTMVAGMARAISTPTLLENYVRGWTGGLGMYVLKATDAGLRASKLVPDPVKPADTLADIPFVKAFVVRYPSANAVPIREFYERNEQNQKVMDTIKILAQDGDMDAAQKVIDNYGMRVTLDQTQQALGGMAQAVRNIYKNPKIPADEKRQLIDTLYFNMIGVSETANKIMDKMDEKLK